MVAKFQTMTAAPSLSSPPADIVRLKCWPFGLQVQNVVNVNVAAGPQRPSPAVERAALVAGSGNDSQGTRNSTDAGRRRRQSFEETVA